MINLILIGAGGFGLEAAAYVRDLARGGADIALRGFLDDTKAKGDLHAEAPILGSSGTAIDTDAHYLIAVGSPAGRSKLAKQCAAKGGRFFTLIHPLAHVSTDAQIGEGSIFAPFALAGPATRIGAHNLFNTYACAGHEAATGACCVLSPYASLHGQACLQDEVFVGGHGFVTAGVTIGSRARLAAGAVTYNDVPPGALAMGNPASCRTDK